MKEIEEDILLFLNNSSGTYKSADYMKTRYGVLTDYENDEIDNAIDNLTSGETKLLKTNSDGEYGLKRNASPIIASIKNSRINSSLLDFQRKSSSIETLFTFSIILFSMIQALRFVDNSKVPFSEHNMALFGLGVGVLILVLALDVGKENLFKTLKEETWIGSFRKKDQWLNALNGFLWGIGICIALYIFAIILSGIENLIFGSSTMSRLISEYTFNASVTVISVTTFVDTTKFRHLPVFV